MVSAVGIAPANTTANCPSCTASRGGSVAALEGQIRQDRIQLNDWTTCVSAKTPKGHAAIQKLSGEISADKEQIARALQNQSVVSYATSAATHRGALDVWA